MHYHHHHHHYCPECEKRNRTDLEKYGFNIVEGSYYWTKITEIKDCCPVKVKMVRSTSNTVTVEINNKTYSMDRTEFLKSSWRDYDSY